MNNERVWFIIRGMTQYISRMYKHEKFGVPSLEITLEELYLARKLKATLNQSFNRLKNAKFVVAHNHCVAMPDREDHVKKSFRTGLIELARGLEHPKFLHECVLYIISATELEQLCFPEAKYIVMDAIYQACMNTKQHEILVLWDTQSVEKKKSDPANLNHRTNQERREEQPNRFSHQDVDTRHNDNANLSSDIDIIG